MTALEATGKIIEEFREKIVEKYPEPPQDGWDEFLKDISEFASGKNIIKSELATAWMTAMDYCDKSRKKYGDYKHALEMRTDNIDKANRQREEERRELMEWRARL